MKLVVVGATGAVGAEILRILETREFPADDVVFVASARSAGRRIRFRDEAHEVVALDESVFDQADIVLFDVPDDVSREWAPTAARRGGIVVDNSAAWRMDPEVPLVVPEVNPEAVNDAAGGIIASPNCTTLAFVVPLAALDREARLKRLIVASYQSASGAGRQGIDELRDQTERVAKEPDLTQQGLARDVLDRGDVFSHPLAMNVIPQCGSVTDGGFTSEELKLCSETRKILGSADLKVTATCVRVPVMIGHGVAVHAEFSQRLDATRAREILEAAPGVEVKDHPANGMFPTPLEAAGRDPCYVGRIRQDPFDDNALEMFCVADNLRKGAALNTVQIAELLVADAWKATAL